MFFLFKSRELTAPEHLANLSSEVDQHLARAHETIKEAQSFAADHHEMTNQTVANLTTAINDAMETNKTVQAKAAELTALAELLKSP